MSGMCRPLRQIWPLSLQRRRHHRDSIPRACRQMIVLYVGRRWNAPARATRLPEDVSVCLHLDLQSAVAVYSKPPPFTSPRKTLV